ncbi:MAG: hypothetical protein OET90_02145 [Desulfuromonadales bacterium]|nr:hypothetical protein [Desulfuromonadales bacterium]
MSDFFNNPQFESLAKEESVRGVVARLAQERSAEVNADEKAVLEEAVQLLLQQFQAMDGESA